MDGHFKNLRALSRWFVCWFLPIWLILIVLVCLGFFIGLEESASLRQLFPSISVLTSLAAIFIAGSSYSS